MMPSVAKRRNIASIRRGGNFVPPSSHQVITAMKTPTTYLTASAYVRFASTNGCRQSVVMENRCPRTPLSLPRGRTERLSKPL